MQDVGDQRVALEQAQRRRLALALEQPENQALDLRLGVLTPHLREPFQVQASEQLVVDASLELLVFAGPNIRASAAVWARRTGSS